MKAADDGFFLHILKTLKTHYALFDKSLSLVELSPDFKSSFPGDWPLGIGEKASAIFQELEGYEDILVDIIHQKHEPLVLERIVKLPMQDRHIPMVESQAEYYSLHASPYDSRLLIVIRDLTSEGALEQQAIQQRNEMDLLTNRLIEDLHRANDEMNQAYMTTLINWAAAVELRGGDSPGRSDRLVQLTRRLAESMGISRQEVKSIGFGALLHDIGEMGISVALLNKPEKLTEEERDIMSWHTAHGYDLLSPIRHLQKALVIPRYHHERWDGSGYPEGLKGEEIPLPARIFAVVDVFDALTSPRPYREAWHREDAVAYIREKAGLLFDPVVVRYFLSIIDKNME
jgi:HD-GYP domain-containing protein (c-di-GMP phosphodiesterase class II)